MIVIVVYDSNGWIMIAIYLIVTIVGVLLILMCVTFVNCWIYMLGIGFILVLGSIILEISSIAITLAHAISFLYEIISISMITISFIV